MFNPTHLTRHTATLLLVALLLITARGVAASPLDNMERERAILITSLLATDLSLEERSQKVQLATQRLAHLERAVWRDKELTKNPTSSVQKALENYELTFLVHAATEKNRSIVDHWLEQMGLSRATIENARVGRR